MATRPRSLISKFVTVIEAAQERLKDATLSETIESLLERIEYKDHFVDLGWIQTSILKRQFTGLQTPFKQRIGQLFKLGPGKFLHQVFGHAIHCSNIWKIDFRFAG
jgi:hypothetical protein